MAGRTLYDRVRSAYGLDSDELLLDEPSVDPVETVAATLSAVAPTANRPVPSTQTPPSPPHSVVRPGAASGDAHAGREDRREAGHEPSPAVQLDETPLDGNVNSVRVPFDPEDQSDDEIVITSVYKRQTNPGNAARGGRTTGMHGEQRGQGPQETAYVTSQRLFQTTLASRAQQTKTTSPATALSATAPAFQPRSSASASASEPAPAALVDIAGTKGRAADGVARGQVYPGNRVAFCPWLIVRNYHLWFVGKQNGERVQPYFETAALLRSQTWDFCYLWHPLKRKGGKIALLVPTDQFQHFLSRINQTLCIQLTIPPGENGDKFRVIFGQQNTPMPRFLGHASDADTLSALEDAAPPLHPKDDVYSAAGTGNKAQEMYLKKVKALYFRYGKGDDKKIKSEKARRKRMLERQAVGKQAKRIQRYLGLREKVDKGSIAAGAPLVCPQALDLTRLVPYAQESDVVFVSMDIESYEYNHRAVTEIGFGILDTRDIVGTPPGLMCENWHAMIRGRHLRLREHATMVNRNFVKGCENNFNFGSSEFVGLKDVLEVVTRILQPRLRNGETRKVVLVGHDIKSDISLVENIGFYLKKHTFLEIVDTQNLHQNLRMRSQQMGLRGVLNDLEIDYSFLHNGGNDAVYTLQAMVSLVVKKRQESLRRQSERLRVNYTPEADVVEQGWVSGGELSDGGFPEHEDGSANEDGPGIPETSQAASAAAVHAMPSRHVVEDWPVLPTTAAAAAPEDKCEDLIQL